MAITQWDPFGDIARLQDQLFGSLGWDERPRRFAPAVDIYEEKDAIFVDAALPGVSADAVNIEFQDNVLTISGERKFDREEKGEGGFRRIEHSYGSFTRSFVVPETVDGEHIEAELRDGVLRLKLPKRAEAEKRKIPVRSQAAGSKDEARIEQPKVRTQRDREEKQAQAQESKGKQPGKKLDEEEREAAE